MKFFWGLFAYVCLLGCSSSIPEPYHELTEVLPYDNQGWFLNKKPLKKIIQRHHIQSVIEVGSWLGKSTRSIAKLLPKRGKVYAVDHWLGSAEHQEGGSAHCKELSQLYNQFLSNVIHAQLTQKIIPVRMDSLSAAKHLGYVRPDLIYLDASHETKDVYEDLIAWFPHVQGHGILCGDDWTWPSVRVAVEQFAKEASLRIEAEGNFWRLHEDIGVKKI